MAIRFLHENTFPFNGLNELNNYVGKKSFEGFQCRKDFNRVNGNNKCRLTLLRAVTNCAICFIRMAGQAHSPFPTHTHMCVCQV